MILDETGKAPVERSGVKGSYTSGINKAAMPHILKVLRDGLYSNKEKAVVREYCTNAWDSHIEAGNTKKPFVITVPTVLDPNLSIRDFGIGLSETNVARIYAMYGESTKRFTNDQTGTLGLGSKAFYAYSPLNTIITYSDVAILKEDLEYMTDELGSLKEEFLLNSKLESEEDSARISYLQENIDQLHGNIEKCIESGFNLKTIYQAFINEEDVSEYTKLSETLTEEPVGVEVVIPVKEKDIKKFSLEVANVLGYFKTRPEIKGSIETLNTIKAFDEEEVLFKGKDWVIKQDVSGRNNQAQAVMGNVAYPISSEVFKGDDIASVKFLGFINGNIVLDFAIGELQMVASREALDYKEKTKTKIKERFGVILKEVEEQFKEKVDSLKTLWDARVYFAEGLGSYPTYLRSHIGADRVFKGMPFTLSIDAKDMEKDYEKYHFELRKFEMKSGVISTISKIGYLQPSKQTVFVIEDITSPIEKAARIRGIFSDGKVNVYSNSYFLVKLDSERFEDEVRNSPNLIGAKFVYLSDFDPVYQEKSEREKSKVIKSSKHSHKVFILNVDKAYNRAKSDVWDETTVDFEEDEGYFVKIRNFEPTEDNSWLWTKDITSFQSLINQFKAIGIDPPTIYGFKDTIKNADNPGPNWSPLKEYYSTKIKDYLRKESLTTEYFDSLSFSHEDEFYHRLRFLLPDIKDQNGTLALYIKALVDCYQSYENPKIIALGKVIKTNRVKLSITGKSKYDVKDMREKVEKKYGLLPMTKDYISPYIIEEGFKSPTLAYINAVDSEKN